MWQERQRPRDEEALSDHLAVISVETSRNGMWWLVGDWLCSPEWQGPLMGIGPTLTCRPLPSRRGRRRI